MRARSPASILLVVAAALVSCGKPNAGDKCKTGRSVCLDKAHALVCRSEAYQPVDCTGETGCHKVGDGLLCDQGDGAEGGNCTLEGRRVCSTDRSHLLVCSGGRFQKVYECRGEGHCAQLGPASFACDQSLAVAKEPCQGSGEPTPEDTKYACSAAGGPIPDLLRCRLGKWEIYHHCRGPKGCKLQAAGLPPVCDESIAEENDACEPTGRVACSHDQSMELLCQGSSFMRGRRCPRGCKVTGSANTIRCD